MRTIFCFGDSNVYGYIPESGKRYPKNSRWSGILAEIAGENYQIIEAGCNNRTAFSKNPYGKVMSGSLILPELLESYFDIVILSVGINDLQFIYNVNRQDFENGLVKLVNIVKKDAPKSVIILLCPPLIGESILKSSFASLFDKSSIEKSHFLAEIYEKVAIENNCKVLNLSEIVEPSDIDGLHFTPESHKKIAESVYSLICSIFNKYD